MKLMQQQAILDRWGKELEPRRKRGVYLDRVELEEATIETEPPTRLVRTRFRFLSAEGQTPTPLEQEALLGRNDLVDFSYLERCALVCRAIGIVSADGARGPVKATSFLIGPGLLMTNHHVLGDAQIAASGTVTFGYHYNVAGELAPTSTFNLEPQTFFVADEALDYAVVAVREVSTNGAARISDFGYLRMHPESGKVREREFVTVIQHPDGQPLQIALRENQVTRCDEASAFIQYEADTAHGSSGAPVLNDSLQIAALHCSGRIKRDANGEYVLRNGKTAKTLDGLSEADVVWDANVGVRASRVSAHLVAQAAAFPEVLPRLTAAMAGGDLLTAAVVGARTGRPVSVTPPPLEVIEAAPSNERVVDGRGLAIPLTLRVAIEDPRARPVPERRAPQPPQPELVPEAFKMQIPVIYDSLGSRAGYDSNFLQLASKRRVRIPSLTAEGKKVAAPLLGKKSYELRYHKFSVIMHKDRRLAVLTASNVDFAPGRRSVNGKRPTRAELTGITDSHTIEQWVTDSRIAREHQLPDIFYNNDKQRFDKGHLVRREDVCWGASFEDIQKANGDTFHVTNCTPQVEELNRSASGEYNWGDFENEVQRQAKTERYCLFSGPVLAADDRWFRGEDDDGAVRIQVPRRFWKIVVAKNTAGAPEAFGFLFEQDVKPFTELEFKVSSQWKHSQAKIADIAELLRGWVDLEPLSDLDVLG